MKSAFFGVTRSQTLSNNSATVGPAERRCCARGSKEGGRATSGLNRGFLNRKELLCSSRDWPGSPAWGCSQVVPSASVPRAPPRQRSRARARRSSRRSRRSGRRRSVAPPATRHLQRSRLRNRREGHRPGPGRLRRIGRAAVGVLGRPGQPRPDPLGAVGDRRQLPPPRDPEAEADGQRDRGDLRRPGQELERPARSRRSTRRSTCRTCRSRCSTARTARATRTCSPSTSRLPARRSARRSAPRRRSAGRSGRARRATPGWRGGRPDERRDRVHRGLVPDRRQAAGRVHPERGRQIHRAEPERDRGCGEHRSQRPGGQRAQRSRTRRRSARTAYPISTLHVRDGADERVAGSTAPAVPRLRDHGRSAVRPEARLRRRSPGSSSTRTRTRLNRIQ